MLKLHVQWEVKLLALNNFLHQIILQNLRIIVQDIVDKNRYKVALSKVIQAIYKL